MNKSIERLSTGFKVNRGADGPAALVISEKQRAQIAGLRTAIENTEKAVAVVQTAEGALNEINSILIKVRSLALDSANSGVNDADAFAANQVGNRQRVGHDQPNRDQHAVRRKERFLTEPLVSRVRPRDADVTFLKGGSNTSDGTYTPLRGHDSG